jgi:hypothetical protein
MPRAVASLLLVLCAGCAQMVRYTDDLVDARTGRTLVTRMPATFGGVVGFVVGVPVDIVAVPVTFAVYQTQEETKRDPLSIFLFPSFLLWHIGTLVGAPIDLIEWGVYRAWQSDDALTDSERERREAELDEVEFTVFPVTPIYPRQTGGH